MNRNHGSGKLLLAVILIVAGGLIILGQMGFVSPIFKRVIFSWPMILVVIGVLSLSNNEHKLPGIILLLIGGFFLATMHLNLPFPVGRVFWPSLLILAGILIIFKSGKDNKSFDLDTGKDLDADIINEANVFGGTESKITSMNFRGGKIVCIFGGSVVDMRPSRLSSGKNVIDVFALFGGAQLVIPEDWLVKTEAFPIFGGFSDKRAHVPTSEIKPEKTLFITGTVVFGGVEISSYHK
ncbi:MAG: LiaF transmembrane domain-containing protein [Bacteroidota bacterium]